MGGGGPPPDPFPAVHSDVPFINCGMCKLVARRAYLNIKTLKASSKARLGEDDVLGSIGKMCSVKASEGAWLLEYDMVEDGDKINLKRKTQAGECETECNTMALACSNILAETAEDLAAAVYSGMYGKKSSVNSIDRKETTLSKDDFVNLLCTDEDGWSPEGSCASGAPKVPASRESGGDNFKPVAKKVEEDPLPPADEKPKKKKGKKSKKKKKKSKAKKEL